MEMAAATSPVVVSPPSKSISPVDSSVAPINEMNTANRIEKDFFSLKNSIMVLLCGIGGNKLKGFYVGFLGFAITDRFDAPVPLQAVVAKQGLAVSDVDG